MADRSVASNMGRPEGAAGRLVESAASASASSSSSAPSGSGMESRLTFAKQELVALTDKLTSPSVKANKLMRDKLQKQVRSLEQEIRLLESPEDGPASPGSVKSPLHHVRSNIAANEQRLDFCLDRFQKIVSTQNWENASLDDVRQLVADDMKDRQDSGNKEATDTEVGLRQLEPLIAEIKQLRSAMEPEGGTTVQTEVEGLAQRLNVLASLPASMEVSASRLLLLFKLLHSIGTNDGGHYLDLMESELKILQSRLVIEQHPEASDAATALQACDSIRALARAGAMEDATTQTASLLSRVQSVDLQELFQLCEENDKAAPNVEGQCLVLLLGGTGSGKSTTIHYLANSEMIQTGKHIEPVRINNASLARIRASPEARSETRFLTVATVPFLDVNILNTGTFLLCDSPGFGDTSGAAMEISNCLGIIRTVRRCSSVKPVIVVSSQVGDRVQMLRKIIRTCSMMISDMAENINKFAFLFTKYSSVEQLAGLREDIASVLRNPQQEENDPNFKLFLERMKRLFPDPKQPELEQIDSPRPINPLEPKHRIDFLRQLLEQLQQDGEEPIPIIRRPTDVFRSFIPDEAAQKLETQLILQKTAVLAAYRRGELEFLSWKLQQLQSLMALMDAQLYSRARNDIVNKLMEVISQEGENDLVQLRRAVEGDYEIHSSNMMSLKTSLQCLSNPPSTLLPQVREAIQMRARQLQQSIAQLADGIGNNLATMLRVDNAIDAAAAVGFNDEVSMKLTVDEHKARSLNIMLQNLTHLGSAVTEPARKWMAMLADSSAAFVMECSEQFCNADHVSQMEQQLRGLEHIAVLRPLLPNLPPVTVQQLLADLQTRLVARVRQVTPYLSMPLLSASHVHELSLNAQILDECQMSVRFVALLDGAEELQVFRRNLPLKIQEFFARACGSADILLKSLCGDGQELPQSDVVADSCARLHSAVEQLEVIRKVPSFEAVTEVKFQELLEKIRGWLQEVKLAVLKLLTQLLAARTDDTSSDQLTGELQSGIAVLRHAAWFSNYRRGVSFDDAVQTILRKITTHARDIDKRIRRLDFSLHGVSGLNEAAELLRAIENAVTIEETALAEANVSGLVMAAATAASHVASNDIASSLGERVSSSLSSSATMPVGHIGQMLRESQEFVLRSVDESLKDISRMFNAQQGVGSLHARQVALQNALTQYENFYPANLFLQHTAREAIVLADEKIDPESPSSAASSSSSSSSSSSNSAAAMYHRVSTLQRDIAHMQQIQKDLENEDGPQREAMRKTVESLRALVDQCVKLEKDRKTKAQARTLLMQNNCSDLGDLRAHLKRQQEKQDKYSHGLQVRLREIQEPLKRALQMRITHDQLEQQRDVQLSTRQQEILLALSEQVAPQGEVAWTIKQVRDEIARLSEQLIQLNRQQLEHAFLKLDASASERALAYVRACARLPLLRRSASETEEKLVGFIASYKKYTGRQLEIALAETVAPLKESSSSSESSGSASSNFSAEVGGGISVMLERLAELQKLSSELKFPLLHLYFRGDDEETSLIAIWRTRLAKYRSQLQLQFDLHASVGALRIGMLVVRELSELDPLLQSRADLSFAELAIQLRKQWEGKMQKHEKTCETLLVDGDFQRLHVELQRLRVDVASAGALVAILSELQHIVRKIMEQVNASQQRMNFSMDDGAVKQFVTDWQKLQTVRDVREWLPESEQERFNLLMQRVPQEMEERLLALLAHASAALKVNKFGEAEPQLLAVEGWRDAMVLKGAQLSGEVSDQLVTLSQQRKIQLETLQLQFANCVDFSSTLELQPGEAIANLERARVARGSKVEAKQYENTADAVQKSIANLFAAQLRKVEKDLLRTALKKKHELRSLEVLLSHLPESLAIRLKAELTSCDSRIHDDSESLRSEIQDLVQRRDYPALIQMLEQYDGNAGVKSRVQRCVEENMAATINQISLSADLLVSMASYADKLVRVQHLTQHAQVLYDCYDALKKQCPDLKKLLDRLNKLTQSCEECIVLIRSSCDARGRGVSPESLDQLQHRMSLFRLLCGESLTKVPGMEWRDGWNASVQDCKAAVCRYFAATYDRFEQLTQAKQLKCSELRDALDYMKAWESRSCILDFLTYQSDCKFCPFSNQCAVISKRVNASSSTLRTCDLGRNELEREEDIVLKLTDIKSKMDEFQAALELHQYCNLSAVESQNSLNKVQNGLEMGLREVATRAGLLVHRIGEIMQKDLAQLAYLLLTLWLAERHLSFLTQQFTPPLYASVISGITAAASPLLRDRSMDNIRLEKFAGLLTWSKRLANAIVPLRADISGHMDSWLLSFTQDNKQAALGLQKLGQCLNALGPLGAQVLDEHGSFKGVQQAQFQKRVAQKQLAEVLKELSGTGLTADFPDGAATKDRIGEMYVYFNQEYQKFVSANNRKEVDFSNLVPQVVQAASAMSLIGKTAAFTWSREGANQEKQLILLLAYIFGVWTLENNSHYWAAEQLEERQNYLLTPHATQVLSIFRMFGIGDTKPTFQNNLVEIGTGEGKSITLAIVSCTLALLGANISCACYSQYLSQRDYDAFVPLFRRLNVLEFIRYGTFNKVCEQWIERKLEGAKLREVTEAIVMIGAAPVAVASAASVVLAASVMELPEESSSAASPASASSSPAAKRKVKSPHRLQRPSGQVTSSSRVEVLLIDEVDVFLDKSFYGAQYPVRASLRHPAVRDVTDLIWQHHKMNLSRPGARTRYVAIEKSPEVQALLRAFPGWEQLIAEAVKDMLAHAATHQTPEYAVLDGAIKYKLEDTYSSEVVYGYRTLFSHYYEHDAGRISAEELAKSIHIGVSCGDFSYAAFPLAFSFVMGVTGTLRVLSSEEKSILTDEYSIHKETFAASMYSKKPIHWSGEDATILCETLEDHHRQVATQIRYRLGTAGPGRERAVLVVFENEISLAAFTASQALGPLSARTNIINEQTSTVNRRDYVRQATQQNRITLTTSSFGRGTDYIVNDPIVANNGGMHVLQAFFSKQHSEEIQIQGRTCRQGDAGSFSMVLLKSQLEPFYGSEKSVFDKLTRIDYDDLHRRRQLLFVLEYQRQRQLARDCMSSHEAAMIFLRDVKSKDVNAVRKFLILNNQGAPDQVLSRTLVLMDATGSMGLVLDAAKLSVREMLRRVSDILSDNKLPPHAFEVQFAVYRNYSCGAETLLESSSWESSPSALQPFLESQKPLGGQGREAIEIALWHANQEHSRDPLSQVILIGDAPPNTEAEVKGNRAAASGGFLSSLWKSGEKYWAGSRYLTPTYWKDESDRLAQSKVPIHAFYLPHGKWAKEDFTKMSTPLGTCQMLDVSSDGTDLLTSVVAKAILGAVQNAAGGITGEQLVAAYNKKFTIRAFTS